MTAKKDREIDRLKALLLEAERQRDLAWDSYRTYLYRVVDAEQKLKQIQDVFASDDAQKRSDK